MSNEQIAVLDLRAWHSRPLNGWLAGFLGIMSKKNLRPLLSQSETVPGRARTDIRRQLVLPVGVYQMNLTIKIIIIYLGISYCLSVLSYFFFFFLVIFLFFFFALLPSRVSNPIVNYGVDYGVQFNSHHCPFSLKRIREGSVYHSHLLLLRSAPLKSSCDRIFSF